LGFFHESLEGISSLRRERELNWTELVLECFWRDLLRPSFSNLLGILVSIYFLSTAVVWIFLSILFCFYFILFLYFYFF
jgi:hypothetical protein